jgi:hypothetical protein
MLRKFGIGLVIVAAVAVIGQLQAKDPEPGHPLRDFFKKKGVVMALPLLKTELVGKELKLTDEQKEKAAPLQKDFQDSMRKIFTENPNLTQGERVKKIDEANAELTKKLETILKLEQIDRLLEILTQLGGPMLFADADIGKTIEFTEEQKKDIKAIEEETKESMGKAMAGMKPATNKADIKKQIKEGFKKQQPLLKEANEKLEKILTPAQREKLAKMKGKEIDTTKLFDEMADAMELPGM